MNDFKLDTQTIRRTAPNKSRWDADWDFEAYRSLRPVYDSLFKGQSFAWFSDELNGTDQHPDLIEMGLMLANSSKTENPLHDIAHFLEIHPSRIRHDDYGLSYKKKYPALLLLQRPWLEIDTASPRLISPFL